MSQFDQPLAGVRWAETWIGDTLQEIAARELGDATLWATLANLNGLIPPYFNPPTLPAMPGILRYGDLIQIPASATITANTGSDPAQIFGVDIALSNSLLTDDGNGDFLSVSGIDNLTQALQNRLATPPNDLIFHPEYRNKSFLLIGSVDGPAATLLSAQYSEACLLADDRVQSVDSVVSQSAGDTINVAANITPITGQPISVSI